MGMPARAKNGQHAARTPVVDLHALHQAVVLGDTLTADALARLVLPRIVASLRREWPGSSSAMIEDAVEDAILWYLANPTRYDPERSGLPTFLQLVARRNMTHARRRERRRLTHEVPMGLTLPNATPAYSSWRASADDLDDQGAPSNDLSKVLALAMTDAEREFVLARAKGEKTNTLATIIGAGGSPDEQRRAVHRVMARLRQRARR
jgi:DNA-directed RNA polymerase specialized sigma24 family protein